MDKLRVAIFWLLRLSLTVLFLMFLLGYLGTDDLSKSVYDAQHSDLIITTLDEALSHIQEIQILSREYIITNEPNIPSKIDTETDTIQKLTSHLVRLTEDNPAQQSKALVFQDRASLKIEFVYKLIDLQRQKDIDKDRPAHVLLTHEGTRLMSQVYIIAKNIRDNEENLLEHRRHIYQRNIVLVKWMVPSVIIIDGILITICYYYIRTQLHHRSTL